MNVNEKVSIEICCGCSACADVCPVNAITMGYDARWQLYPQISDACIHCGKCVNVCPQLKAKPANKEDAVGFAVVAPDEVRIESSSGGVFPIIARHILKEGGYVAGAVFDENWAVKHIVSDDIADIVRMQHSKYVQSQTAGIYKDVARLLKEGKTVLFTGTPCQVAAIRNFTGDKYDNLLTVDILCHGVPSPKVWEYYLNENFDKSQIKDIIFRNKRHRNANPTSVTFILKSGREVYSEFFDNAYVNAFLGNISERSSCFRCRFAVFPRVGDISIGDFWGAKTTQTKIDYEKGCSVLFLNNTKGESIWERVKTEFKTIEKYDNTTLMSWNRNKVELKHNKRYSELVSAIEKNHSLRTAVNKVKDERYDVGLFGIIPNSNYGGLITYYALYEYVRSLGYSVLMIHQPGYNAGVYKVTHATKFFEENCTLSEIYKPKDLYQLNDKVDMFLLGSDQVWNYSLFHCWYENLYFDFVDKKKKKIAYAASFGHDRHTVDQDRKGLVSALIKEFDHIGVRETDGVALTDDLYHKHSVAVCDPVFLLDIENYKRLAEKARVKNAGKYVGAYIIEPNNWVLDIIKRVVDHLKIGNVNFTDGNMNAFDRKSKYFYDKKLPLVNDASIENWLHMILNAEFVITDSFHCSCFCIMFHKPFIVVQPRWALSRLNTLMETYGLQNRWLRISSIKEFALQEEWFADLPKGIDAIAQEQREHGRQWLQRALSSSKTVLPNYGMSAANAKVRVEDYFFFLLQKREDYILILSSAKPSNAVINRIDFKCKLSYIKGVIDEKKAYLMIYDFSKGVLVQMNEEIIDHAYQTANKKLLCIVNALVRKVNKIYVNEGENFSVTEVDPESAAVISIYSKTEGRIIDSFNVFLENNVAMIKRKSN